jgi:hypothetical protein
MECGCRCSGEITPDIKLLFMRNLTIIILILLSGGCSQKECKKADPKEIDQIIVDYFKAISDNEFDKLYKLSTSDFILYENGVIWNNDSLIQAVKKRLSLTPDSKTTYRFENFNTKVDCNSARTDYLNIGKRELRDTTFTIRWLESATFVKEDGKWKLEFLHSTRLK